MNILALDASGKSAGVCIMQNGVPTVAHTLSQGLTHSETMLPLVQRCLAEAGLSPARLDAYAVTSGPGSFTGLRIGLALVKGLALPFQTPVAGFSTLHALAEACGLEGTVIAALDARRGEVYWAAFRCQNGSSTRLTEDTAGPADEIADSPCFSNSPLFFIGDGAKICYNAFELYPHLQPAPEDASRNIALGTARLAAKAAQTCGFYSAEKLLPSYLRLSQAERERLARTGQ